ncbi:MAG: CCA tRNA nucleotidyltransferase [Chloroflexi bacterium]|nr:CCA tRNA nucleotidyltransferase [Chloroflexota bacterium]MCI0833463.1 CCA tRNA nucleotidyltransferase [Chloroflexota bacterium]MCI0870449.1 CCA tRNA nucleotidyltransferase [Chloroflexota bacterium]
MPNLAQLLTSKSSVEQRRIIDLCRELSADIANVDGVYVVGGFVRDVILGRKPGDVDISVVGDAGAFSEALADRLGTSRPVESEFLTYKIVDRKLGDGKLTDDDGATPVGAATIDVVTARSESYPEPAALPEVVPSSIEDDLRRRDFTVHSMAVSLSGSSWGNLVDPMNGFGDIMRKRIRVLHDSSFIDDPTRMFRAVRYANRLDFSIDSRTEILIAESLGNVDLLSGARLRNEFELILAEPKRVDILRMSEELGLLAAISHGLRVGSRSLKVLESPNSNAIEDLLALTTFGLSHEEAEQTAHRFDGPDAWTMTIKGNPRLADLVTVLDRTDIRRSEIAEILDAIPLPSIRAYIAAGPPLPRRDRMADYMDRIRFEKPEITGDDLIAAGIPEGPVIGQLIDLVKRARLDGQVNTKQEELKLAKSRLPGFLTGPG